ncbi:glycoside hydrolase family 9 protein [uncultured Bacteroides sp.]|uniref:glycoside hydrolase family 9 protein n=1 Tax=uncultured Bacteroides sp. TaxID=162156 RepID=UPI002AA7182C|nr:glycoside hydrolase family 9 protein [uncultured Bacteroides sp.]
MKCNRWLLIVALSAIALGAKAGEWIRINQLGYLPQSKKVAVFMSESVTDVKEYALVDAFTGKTACTFASPKATGRIGRMESTYRLDFSDFNQPGTYYLRADKAKSPRFPIGNQVYDGTADFLLNYMRQQRCGYNPFLRDSCHVHDGYIVYHPTKNGQHIDVRGGWHDATDYLQYTTTSANAIYQMMFAYQQNPESFADAYDAAGLSGTNGIPDIVDEIKWGLDWLDRMNPVKGELYNQIADDRDHAGMRLPNKDKVDYGYGPGNGRPVYFCSGEKQVRGKFMNATTGVASTAGKFASCFALGADILKKYYPAFSAKIAAKANDAYQQGIDQPGACQTASVVSPYIYEEDNWTDDMELAATELYRSTGDGKYMAQAIEYGRREPVTPWMGADSARHYQWYPFMNMGHYRLAKVNNERISKEFIRNMRAGISRVYEKAIESPFLYGIPSIWCSNNLTVAMLTQCRLYREITGDKTYQEMETSLLDWLFGCNPWGTSMIVELPLWGDYPSQPHSSILNAGMGNTTGGLVDGPVYSSIFESLSGVHMEGGEDYARFQPGRMVYHDDIHDYSTNEPTMDGTASLTYYLSSLQKEGMTADGIQSTDRNIYSNGGIIRTDPSKKQITLVFTAADKADGAETIIKTLKKHRIKGAFFFTGDFYKLFPNVISRLKADGHYVGAHSYAHPLYCSWEKRDSTLITREEFEKDLQANYRQMNEAGIKYTDAPYFIPPYEYYNAQIASWTKSLGLQLINFTPGTMTNADYTTPDMKNYRSSKEIYKKIMTVEAKEGLNGHIILIHFGTDDKRIDKFYASYMEKMINSLQKKGYSFVPLKEAIGLQ